MDTLGDIPGLPGIFLAGVFSAALSSLSTGLNSMSAIVLEDFYKLYFGKPSPLKAEIIMKTVVVVVGVSCVGLAFLVEKMGTVLQVKYLKNDKKTVQEMIVRCKTQIMRPWQNI